MNTTPPAESSALSELEEYAVTVVLDHARDVDPLAVYDMADEHLGRDITDDEAKQVLDLITRAEVTVTLRPAAG